VAPFEVTLGALATERPRAADPAAARVTAGFRAIFQPSLKLNSKWFVQSTIQVQSEPFFYYEAFYPEKGIESRVQRLVLGYRRTDEGSTIEFKVGKMPS